MRMSPRENKSVIKAKENMLKYIPGLIERIEKLEEAVLEKCKSEAVFRPPSETGLNEEKGKAILGPRLKKKRGGPPKEE